jgi:hypothetical protein
MTINTLVIFTHLPFLNTETRILPRKAPQRIELLGAERPRKLVIVFARDSLNLAISAQVMPMAQISNLEFLNKIFVDLQDFVDSFALIVFDD